MNSPNLTGYGKTVMRAIKESGRAVPLAGGGWRVGAKKVPLELGHKLMGQDLVMKGVMGELVITQAGRSWLIRAHGETNVEKASGAPSPFKRQHQAYETRKIDVEGRPEKVTVNIKESPLSWLAGRKGKDGQALIKTSHLEAGERLREDFEMGHFQGRMTSLYEARPLEKGRRAAPGMNATERQISAKGRFDAAVSAMGPGLADVACRVCCQQQGLKNTEDDLGWPSRSAKIVLRIALDRLADHYGIRG